MQTLAFGKVFFYCSESFQKKGPKVDTRWWPYWIYLKTYLTGKKCCVLHINQVIFQFHLI